MTTEHRTSTIGAYALTPEQAKVRGGGYSARTILIQQFHIADGRWGLGWNWTLDGDTPDEDAMDAILEANGYRRVSPWRVAVDATYATVEQVGEEKRPEP